MLLHELAERIATHRATEAVLFEHVGAWVTATAEPALKPVLAAWSARHAAHLDLWAQRFPEVDGLDVEAATRDARAALRAVEERLDQAGTTAARLAAALTLLERLEADCARDRAGVDPLLDAPTARVLDVVLADVRADIDIVRAHV